MQSFLNTFKEFLYLFAELSILFIAISFLVSIINQKYEGIFKNNLLVVKFQVILSYIFRYFNAILFCSTIPLLRAFLEAKVKLSVTLVYLFTSPVINPIIFSMFFVTFGLKLSLIYVVFLIFIISFVFSKFNEVSFLKHISKKYKIKYFYSTSQS